MARSALVLVVIALSVPACGSSSSPPATDGGALCTPFGGECPAGTTCDFLGSCGPGLPEWSCRPIVTPSLMAGQSCGAAPVNSCAARTSCLTSVTSAASCVPLCRDANDCSAGQICEQRTVSAICPAGRRLLEVRLCLTPAAQDGGARD